MSFEKTPAAVTSKNLVWKDEAMESQGRGTKSKLTVRTGLKAGNVSGVKKPTPPK